METVFKVWLLDERSHVNWKKGLPEPHCHPHHQVILILRGSGTHLVDGVETRILGPWVMLVAKGKKHLYMPDAHDEGWMIDFGEEFLDQDASWVFSDFLASPNLPLPGDALCRQMGTLARLMWTISKSGSAEARPVLRHLMSAFLHLLQPRIRAQATQTQAHLTGEFKLFHAFLQELDGHYRTGKEVGFYAQRLRCTPRRLSAACRLVLGKTPQLIVIERCMLEAKRLLVHSDLSVQQIAAELGWEDQSNFTKTFRKATGETPTSFRKARSLARAGNPGKD